MYFNEKGKVNTEKTIELAVKAAKENNISNIVVASCSGNTAKCLKDQKDLNIICVTHAYGFKNPGKNEMTDDTKEELKNIGIQVLTTTHVLSGAERGISKKFGGINPVEIVAYSLRMLGQGVKVCAEISIMALDSGLIPYGEKVIAIGGSAYGADTAVVITPAHANDVFQTKIHEIICKPRQF
ncbi:pyruvate kinase alpha/beta domain-containing protein [Clostridium thailandense]|uniref:Pyruvate kinase C-terminal domain-containing protein n=1 Tax=Clostridium thailandense TaxID=2794346 RepID=A0A949TKB0_9CLOT|nr:pyruvate kinase alpha/beta domain-containing protein [Clostridium thailandense]MBV7274419.1 hypothetical protein [Clostridium thailandense]